MKKELFLVLAGLTMISFSVFGSGKQESRSQTGAADVAEVADIEYYPRQYPGLQRAGGGANGEVYALSAAPLIPEAERLPPPVWAITGVRGQEISESTPWEVVDIWVILPEKETFSKGIIEGFEVNEWIINLPKGLKARAHRVRKGANRINIYISGKPEVTGRDYVKVNIPGEYLTGGAARQFVSPTEEESRKAWEENETKALNQ